MQENTRTLLRRTMPGVAIAITALTGAAGISTVGFAQDATPPGLSEPSQDVSDQKIDAAAAALERVAALKNEYEDKIEGANAADKERLADEAHDKMVKAVADQGLSVGEYASILVVAQNNPAVREKLIKRIVPPDESE
jgi:hypothetical protein